MAGRYLHNSGIISMNGFFKKNFAYIRFKGFKSHQKRGKGHITLHTRLIRRKQLVL